MVAELTRPPAAPEDDDATADSADWEDSPVQSIIITSTDRGTYNTPIEIFALHSCQQDKDYYLVNTGGTWTAEFARYQSASWKAGQMRLVSGALSVDWHKCRPSQEGLPHIGAEAPSHPLPWIIPPNIDAAVH